jgi:hypothetical protein
MAASKRPSENWKSSNPVFRGSGGWMSIVLMIARVEVVQVPERNRVRKNACFVNSLADKPPTGVSDPSPV